VRELALMSGGDQNRDQHESDHVGAEYNGSDEQQLTFVELVWFRLGHAGSVSQRVLINRTSKVG
jgi:hypothetical protein